MLLKAFGRRFSEIRDQKRHINAILSGLLPGGFDGLARKAFHGRKITNAEHLRQGNKAGHEKVRLKRPFALIPGQNPAVSCPFRIKALSALAWVLKFEPFRSRLIPGIKSLSQSGTKFRMS